MVTRGTGWDPSPKEGTFRRPPVRSHTLAKDAMRETLWTTVSFAPQAEDGRVADPLHSTPPFWWQLWPQTVPVMSFVMSGRAQGVTLLGFIPFSWGLWQALVTQWHCCPREGSLAVGSSCKAHLRLSSSASHRLPTVRNKGERSPEHHLWQQI